MAALRQFYGIKHCINPHETRMRTVGVSEDVVDDTVTIMIGLLNVIIIGQHIGDADDERNIKRGNKANIIHCRRIIVGRDDDDVDKALGISISVVGNAIDEAGGDACVEIGRKQQIAILIIFNPAVDGGGSVIAPPEERDGIAVNIGVVGEQHRNRNDRRHIFIDIDRIRCGNRGAIADIFKIECDLGI